jgi:signal transduction histidine kinase/phage shock protein PspC (stress-responsive transcriptional regulator)
MAGPTPAATPTLYRNRDGAVVAGVARGIADHLEIDVVIVRIVFVVLALAGGVGVVLYGAFWIVVPNAGDDVPVTAPGAPPSRRRRPMRVRDAGVLLAGAAIVIGVALLLVMLGVLPSSWLPGVVAVIGLGLVWLRSDDESWTRVVSRVQSVGGVDAHQGRVRVLQLVAGVVLVLVGALSYLASRGAFTDSGRVLLAVTVTLLGVGLLAAPWVVRLLRERDDERRARIRTEERAEIAAQVHDSVLQTLTLIQRSAGDPTAVQRLARAQERDLRQWLYAPVPDATATLRGALEDAAAEVEGQHGGTVEVVCVGDAALDERTNALVAAAREAMVNAAKYSGGATPTVSVYGEVEPADISVFVRDRGVGFDPASVPDDRLGIRRSIIERMERHGGTATISSEPGSGTQVELHLPRAS